MSLKGGINFRDLGGHRTVDGRRVKKNKLFRSGALAGLTPEDCAYLEALAVKHILDYRDHHESEKEKNIIWNGVEYEICPASPKSHSVAASGLDFFSETNLSALPHDFMHTFYQSLPFGNAAYRRLFEKLQALEEGGFLHHCAVGKDRTGVGSALILLSLGVPKTTVIEDYLQTEEGLRAHRLTLIARFEAHLSEKSRERLHHVVSVSPEFLEASFQEILKRYSSFETYFEAEYTLDEKKLEALREKYLE